MGNILFQNQNSNKPMGNSALSQINQIRQQGPSNVIFNQMYNTNPQFKQFADSMRGKTPEQAFGEKGLDFNQFRHFRW